MEKLKGFIIIGMTVLLLSGASVNPEVLESDINKVMVELKSIQTSNYQVNE